MRRGGRRSRAALARRCLQPTRRRLSCDEGGHCQRARIRESIRAPELVAQSLSQCDSPSVLEPHGAAADIDEEMVRHPPFPVPTCRSKARGLKSFIYWMSNPRDGAGAGEEGARALARDDLLETTDEALVVLDRVKLDARLQHQRGGPWVMEQQMPRLAP